MKAKQYECISDFMAVNEVFGSSYGQVPIKKGLIFQHMGFSEFGKKLKLATANGNLIILVKLKDVDKYFKEVVDAD